MRPSQLLQTSDEVAALDFDLACTAELAEYDNERHEKLIDALVGGAPAGMVGGAGSGSQVERSGPITLDA